MLGVSTPIFRRPAVGTAAVLLVLLALLPVVYIALRVAAVSSDVAYWDELDTAIQLLLQLDIGLGWRDFIARIFAVSNEHRMVTSRMMFAASYWLTGTINFNTIGLLGNASIVALCGLLVYAAETPARRLRLAVPLALLLFQLQHWENFLWSGSSIDHFQVVLLAGAAAVGIARGTRPALLFAALCAILATFTLAHGIVTWAVGAALLARTRRFRHLAIWGGVGAVALAEFFGGFHLNPAQRFADYSADGLLAILRYWLALLGAVPALGFPALAPWLGALLLAALGWLAWRGAIRREIFAYPLAGYAIAALGLIAIGRAAETGGHVHSRYYVLGALAWALTIFMALERYSDARRPYRLLWACAPLLIVFNVAANLRFASDADTWQECRDRAAVRYKQHGIDGRGAFSLYPMPARSTRLLQEAEQRGIYRMAPICEERSFPSAARPSERIAYFVEEVAVTGRSAAVVGWAAIPGQRSKRGQIHVMLRSQNETHLFTAVTVTRPDVAQALNEPGSVLAGFRFARRRDRLPTGEFQVGFLIDRGRGAEYVMTDHRLRLVGEGKALLASTD